MFFRDKPAIFLNWLMIFYWNFHRIIRLVRKSTTDLFRFLEQFVLKEISKNSLWGQKTTPHSRLRVNYLLALNALFSIHFIASKDNLAKWHYYWYLVNTICKHFELFLLQNKPELFALSQQSWFNITKHFDFSCIQLLAVTFKARQFSTLIILSLAQVKQKFIRDIQQLSELESYVMKFILNGKNSWRHILILLTPISVDYLGVCDLMR